VFRASVDEYTSVVETETSHSRERQALDAEKLVERRQTISFDARALVNK
jgi:hypothetical protein